MTKKERNFQGTKVDFKIQASVTAFRSQAELA